MLLLNKKAVKSYDDHITVNGMVKEHFNMQSVYIDGPAGTGKTFFTSKLSHIWESIRKFFQKSMKKKSFITVQIQ